MLINILFFFIKKLIENMFSSSENLIQKCSKLLIYNSRNSIYNEMDQKNKKTLIDEIFDKIKHNKCYHKAKLLNLLSKMCVFQNNAIYFNQEKIFKHLYNENEGDSFFSFDFDEKINKTLIKLRINVFIIFYFY